MSLWKLFNKAGLKSKIIAAAVFIIVTTTIVSSGFFYTKIKTILFQNLKDRGNTICEHLANSAKYRILTEDKAILNEIAQGVMQLNDVVYVVIANENNSVLAEKAVLPIPDISNLSKTVIQTQSGQFITAQNSFGEQIYCFCYPVIAKKVSITELIGVEPEQQTDTASNLRGIIHVGLSPRNTVTRLDNMLKGIILLTVIIICCGIASSISFTRLMIKPIRQMAKAASKVAAGDLSQTVSVESKDEIGQFAQQFNTMTAALKNRQQQLDESYDQLSASEERYRVFIQNSSESIWCFEPKDGNPYPADLTEDDLIKYMLLNSIIVECNDAMAKLHDKNSREDVLGSQLGCFMSPNDPENIENLQAFVRNSFHLPNAEREDTDGSGQMRVTFSTFVGIAHNEQLLRVWVIQRDVSDIKRAEKAQAELYKQIKHANQELKDFAYVASHDLKAPLRGIKTLAEWIVADYADKFDDTGKQQLRLLTSRVDRMHNLIDGILQYSRVGRIHETPMPINLNTLIPDIIDMVAPPANIEITVQNNLPIFTFEETRIRQVFQNLISNAVKYMDKPHGKISIGCVDDDKFWKFNVIDNGPGIEEKYFEKIFRIFQTLSPRENYESTGIGLTLVKKIVELYGGKVWVESEVGQGSTFFFTILKEQPISAKYTEMRPTESAADESKIVKTAIAATADMKIQKFLSI